jgi:GT2 family glycosyltransferase
MQEKYGSFDSEKQASFCILVNQFNTSLTSQRANLKSILGQTYENYRVVVLDNSSGDGSYEIAKITLNDWA